MSESDNAPVSPQRSDVAQAQLFYAELEQIADTLAHQVDRLEQLRGAKRQAARRRSELYDVRRQIDALHTRFGSHLTPHHS